MINKTVKVKMLTVSAGPKGVLRIGDIAEVAESEAALLVENGYGELAEISELPDHTNEKSKVISEAAKPKKKE